ncbi:MAG: hypothetical protein JWN90_493 [Parcubacteria group bacterium]|nr:hypothetical protein [Parcubacteria group bacterium]
MNPTEETPTLQETLKELSIEVRRLRYLFSISIIVLALVLMFVTPVVIRSAFDYRSSNTQDMPNIEMKSPGHRTNTMMATSTASTTPIATTTLKK